MPTMWSATPASTSGAANGSGSGSGSKGGGSAFRSCEPCKRRKTKCDRNQPCSSCVLRSTVHLCVHPSAQDADSSFEGSNAPRSAPQQAAPAAPAVHPGLEGAPQSVNAIRGSVSVGPPSFPSMRTSSSFSSSSGAAVPPTLVPAAAAPASKRRRVEPTSTQLDLNGVTATTSEESRQDAIRAQIANVKLALASLESLVDVSRAPHASIIDSHLENGHHSTLIAPGAGAAIAADSSSSTGDNDNREYMQGFIIQYDQLDGELAIFGERSDPRPQLPDHFDVGTAKASDKIPFEKVKVLLPSVEESERLIEYYFAALADKVPILHPPTLRKYWHRWIKQGEPIARPAAATFALVLALTGLLMPAAHESLPGYTMSPKKLHARLFRVASDILDGRYSQPAATDPLGPIDSSFVRVIADTLIMSYAALSGLNDIAFHVVGIAARRGEAISLFDERSRRWDGLTDLGREMRRRVAYQIMIVDRWQAWHFMRSFAIIPSFFNVSPPLYDSEDAYDEDTGMRQPNVPPSANGQRLALMHSHADALVLGFQHLRALPNMKPAERYRSALQLDELLESQLHDVLAHSNLTVETVQGGAMEDSFESHNRWALLTLIYAASYHLRCSITRPFLEDENAPAELRFAALHHARRIIELIPLVLRLSKSPWASFQACWMSGYLLSASTAFAVPLLSGDMDKASPGSASSSSSRRHQWPREDIDWFSNKILDTLDALETLHLQGNHSARICHRLLQSLCNSRQELGERYIARKKDQRERMRQEPAAHVGKAAEARPPANSAVPPAVPSTDAANGVALLAAAATNAADAAGAPQLPATAMTDQWFAALQQPMASPAAAPGTVPDTLLAGDATLASLMMTPFDWAELMAGLGDPTTVANGAAS